MSRLLRYYGICRLRMLGDRYLDRYNLRRIKWRITKKMLDNYNYRDILRLNSGLFRFYDIKYLLMLGVRDKNIFWSEVYIPLQRKRYYSLLIITGLVIIDYAMKLNLSFLYK